MALWRHTKTGRELVSSQEHGYPWVNMDDVVTYQIARRTIAAILKDVGEDAELAQAALDAELEGEQPRTTLVTQLKAIIKAADDE